MGPERISMKTNWAMLFLAGLLAFGLFNGVTLAQDDDTESSDTAPILDFFKQTKVSGYVDAYYGVTANSPDSGDVD